MRYGFVGSSGTVQQVLEQSVAADTTGWDGFFTWDAISVGAAETWDPWTLLAAAAVRTERVRLGAMVFALARRRPWKVAREALTVDHLSGGRLVLPVGLGVPDDGGFARVNGEASTAHERAERLDEALAILDWRGAATRSRSPVGTTPSTSWSCDPDRSSGHASRCGWWERGRARVRSPAPPGGTASCCSGSPEGSRSGSRTSARRCVRSAGVGTSCGRRA